MGSEPGQMRTWIITFLVALLLIAGCGEGMGYLAYVFTGPKKVDPVYNFPRGKKVLVFVDDMAMPVSDIAIKSELTDRLNKKLVDNGVAAQCVPYQQLLNLMAATPDFNSLSIGKIGAKLQADLVLYVNIDEFTLKEEEGVPLWRGKLKTTLRVIDTKDGRLWPVDQVWGYPVGAVETPPSSDSSPTYGTIVTKALAKLASSKIAKLFHEHKVDPYETNWQSNHSNW